MNEYFQRWLGLRPLILAHPLLQERVLASYRAVYDHRLSDRGALPLASGLIHLGQGQIHDVIGLGISLEDSGKKIPLALKLSHAFPYRLMGDMFRDLITCYEEAFERNSDSLSFVGVVTAEAEVRKIKRRVAGVLTEDVTCNKLYPLEEEYASEECTVLFPNGFTRRVLLDPQPFSNKSLDKGKKYLEDSVRIDF